MGTRNRRELDRLEAGLDALRAESRADFRFLLIALVGILVTMMLIVTGVLLQLG